MKLYIRSMIFSSSRILVESELIRLGIIYTSIKSGEINGEIELDNHVSNDQIIELKMTLQKYGFELRKDLSLSQNSKLDA